jgi:hypothetical protein
VRRTVREPENTAAAPHLRDRVQRHVAEPTMSNRRIAEF